MLSSTVVPLRHEHRLPIRQSMQHSSEQHPQASNKSGREEFRSACDRCASSKIRCNKEQPRCQRCRQQGLPCVYGRSRRKGKPPSKITVPPAPSEPLSTSASTSPEPGVEDWHSQPWHLEAYDGLIDRHQRPLGEGECRREVAHGEFGDSQCPFPILHAPDTGHWPTLNSSLGDQLFTQSGSAPPLLPPPRTILSAASATNLPDTEMADMAADWANDDPNRSCIATAFSTLSSLYQLSRNSQDTHAAGCRQPSLSTSATRTASTDLFLRTTRNATRTLSRLIACTCSSCVSESTLPFVLANIAVKVFGEYRAFCEQEICSSRDSFHRPRQDSSSGSPRSTNSSFPPLPGDGLSPMFTTLGGFQLPRATQTRMKAQLLLCELEPLAQAGVALERRMRTREERRGEDQVWKSIEHYLKQGVGDLMRSLEAVCGRID
jgi:Aflatoxin regulatory protein/Fungal Zn(2)-Cys(6) binuclear cluster domain